MAKSSNEPTFVRGEPYAFMEKARRITYDYIRATKPTEEIPDDFRQEDIDCYWFAKDGKDWRVALRTTFPDNVYYRVTHDSHKEETRLDVYGEFYTITIPDKDNP